MKLKILSVILLALAMKVKAAPGSTGTVFSATTVSNMFYTNNIWLSNRVWIASGSNTDYSISNLTFGVSNQHWLLTNLVITTNFVNVSPNQTNTLYFTNGVLKKVTVP